MRLVHSSSRLAAAVIALWLGLVSAPLAQAQQSGQRFGTGNKMAGDSHAPALLTADLMTYDQQLGVATASGNVELTQNDRNLQAERVTYSEREGKVTASGNVVLLEPSGEVLFADYVELTDEFKNGFISGVKMLLSDNSRLAANAAERRDGNKTYLSRAVYSPCELCANDPEKPPLWQIKAIQVIHDQDAQRVEYKDAVMELFGVPMLYTPYFSHPDPTVYRQSGFLAPSISRNNFFGARARTPYYWVLDDQSDLTVTPQVTSSQGVQLGGAYRQRTQTGDYRLDASGTYVDQLDNAGVKTGNQEVRGHIRGEGAFKYDDEFSYGFNVFRTTDRTYLQRYSISGVKSNTLTSRLYAQGINGRNFASVNAFGFQSVREDLVPGSSPIVAPLLDYNYVGEPDEYGGHYGMNANAMSLSRADGVDSRRVSTNGFWQLPYYGPMGDVYTMTTGIRADGYYYDDQPVNGGDIRGPTESGFAGRVRPYTAVDWRYPFVNDEGSVRQLIEPIVAAVITPYGGNPRKIPNEDSQSFEFDDTNLFSLDRFPGLDRYDGGPRLNVGMRGGVYGALGGYTEVLAGQSFRLHDDHTFAVGSGLTNDRSDYVGRLTISPNRYLTVIDRLRVDEQTSQLRRHEVSATMGPRALNVSVAYAKLDKSLFTKEFVDREAVSAGVNARLSKYWNISATHLRELGDAGGSLRSYLALRYTDDCFDIMLFADRTFTIDGEIRPATTFGVKFNFLTFG